MYKQPWVRKKFLWMFSTTRSETLCGGLNPSYWTPSGLCMKAGTYVQMETLQCRAQWIDGITFSGLPHFHGEVFRACWTVVVQNMEYYLHNRYQPGRDCQVVCVVGIFDRSQARRQEARQKIIIERREFLIAGDVDSRTIVGGASVINGYFVYSTFKVTFKS